MKNFENNFYDYSEKESKLKFYSDEFERLLSNCGIILEDIELEKETGDIYCYVDNLNFDRLNCKKFDQVLKRNVPYIQDVFIEEDFFVMTFNVDRIELS